MENPIYIALSRQTALRRQMSVVANNIANLNTTAFKKELMIYQAYPEKTPFTPKLDFVIDQGTATDHTQGNLKVTHNTRSEEHTSELQSLMRTSYAVFSLKKKKKHKKQ